VISRGLPTAVSHLAQSKRAMRQWLQCKDRYKLFADVPGIGR